MEERAQRIVEAAVALAEEGGFEAVRLREVAAQSGVALGTVYSRFPSKEAILVAALDREVVSFAELLHEYPVAGETPCARLSFFFKAASLGLFARQGFARAVLRALGSGERGIADHIIGYQDRMVGLIVAAMRGGSDCGDSHKDDGADRDRSFMLQQIWYAELIGWVAGVRTEDQVVEHMNNACRLMLCGRGGA